MRRRVDDPLWLSSNSATSKLFLLQKPARICEMRGRVDAEGAMGAIGGAIEEIDDFPKVGVGEVVTLLTV